MISARQAGSFWLKIGTPQGEPVRGLALAVAPEVVVEVGDANPIPALGTTTTSPFAVQQRNAEWPFVKLSASTSASMAAVAGCAVVSAIHSSKRSGWPAAWFSLMNASFLASEDQAGLTTQNP